MESEKNSKGDCFNCFSKNQILAGAIIILACLALYLIFAHSRSHHALHHQQTDKEIFTKIYTVKRWEELSGPEVPKDEKGHHPFVDYLQDFIDEHDISTIVDIGCGYGELLKDLNLPESTTYLGLDIVDSVITYNRLHYKKENMSYDSVDNVEDLSKYKGDLLILKDVIQHWNNKEILYAKDHILPNFKYAIIVNNIHVPGLRQVNSEIKTGQSRPLNLEISPFYMKLKTVKDYKAMPHGIKRIYLYENKMDSKKSVKV